MNPELEPSIGEKLAAQEANIIRGCLRLGLGENHKKLVAEQVRQQRENSKNQKTPPHLPPSVLGETPNPSCLQRR